MKQVIKGMILLLMVLVCRQGIANDVQEKSIWKVFQVDEKAVLISDDLEMWLLHGLQPNVLTWSEWVWGEEVPQPDDCYFFDRGEWKEGKKISIVYFPWENCAWKDTYRNDASILQSCDYVIENDTYKTRVFAKPLQLEEVVSLYAIVYERAYALSDEGLYWHSARLLEQELAFVLFVNKAQTECKNKIEGKPFDGQYSEFYEKHGPFSKVP